MGQRCASGLSRRAAFGVGGTLAALTHAWPATAQQAAFRAEWNAFVQRYVTAEGRIVDTGNGGVSHSEGQGWALLFAEHANDRDAFDRILSWTERTLKRKHDALHAWRYRPGAAMPVDDPNNATDGDICIAWSLLLAARRWRGASYLRAGKAIAGEIVRTLLRQAGPYTVLLPGVSGFESTDAVVVNPSYYVFPAFGTFHQALPDPRWPRVAQDGLKVMRNAAFGRWGLPPDWVRLAKHDGAASLPDAWPPRFSYDAVRVPLYLAWAGLDEPALARAAAFWADPGHKQVPAWANLTTDAVSPYAATTGVVSIAQLALAARSPNEPLTDFPIVSSAPDYFSAALTLLARLADAHRRASRPHREG